MNEYETASLAIREATLALQQQGEYLKPQGEALRTLIEWTAPQK